MQKKTIAGKQIKVTAQVHKKLKLEATKRGLTIGGLLFELVAKF